MVSELSKRTTRGWKHSGRTAGEERALDGLHRHDEGHSKGLGGHIGVKEEVAHGRLAVTKRDDQTRPSWAAS